MGHTGSAIKHRALVGTDRSSHKECPVVLCRRNAARGTPSISDDQCTLKYLCCYFIDAGLTQRVLFSCVVPGAGFLQAHIVSDAAVSSKLSSPIRHALKRRSGLVRPRRGVACNPGLPDVSLCTRKLQAKQQPRQAPLSGLE